MIDINHNFTKEFNFFRPFERIYYCFEFTLLIFYSFEYFQNAVHQVIVSLFNMKKSKRNCSLYFFQKRFHGKTMPYNNFYIVSFSASGKYFWGKSVFNVVYGLWRNFIFIMGSESFFIY